MRVVLPHLHLAVLAPVLWVWLAAASAIAAAQPSPGANASPLPPAQAAPQSQSRPKLFLSSEHTLPEELWRALFAALPANLPDAVAKLPPNQANPEFIRGDDRSKEDFTGTSITVYLRGDCLPSGSHLPFGIYVDGDVYTNTVESAFSLLKRGIIGTWHRVSAKHLQAYLNEMCFRFDNRKNPYLFRDTLLRLLKAEHLEYKELTAA
jgi:hypothetical protein